MHILELENGIRKKIGGTTFQGGLARDAELVDRVTYLDYKIDLYHTNYSFVYYDSFVTDEYMMTSSLTAYYNEEEFVIESLPDGQTQFVSIEYPTEDLMSDIHLKVNGSGDLGEVVCLLSTDYGNSWYQISPFVDITLPEPADSFIIGFVFPAVAGIKISDYGLFIGNLEEEQ